MPQREGAQPSEEDPKKTPNKKDGQPQDVEKSRKKQEKKSKPRKEEPRAESRHVPPRKDIPVRAKKEGGTEDQTETVHVRYEDALVAAKTIKEIRDVNDADPKAKVQIKQSEIESFVAILRNAGYDDTYIGRLSTAALVDSVEELFKGSVTTSARGHLVVEVEEVDAEEKSRVTEQVFGQKGFVGDALAREMLNAVQEKIKREEDLTREKIAKRLEIVDDTGRASEILEPTTPIGKEFDVHLAPSRVVETDESIFKLPRDKAQGILEEGGTVDKYGNPVVLPGNWDSLPGENRVAELMARRGVSDTPRLRELYEIRGGATVFPAGNDTADYAEARSRLSQLVDMESAGTPPADLQADRGELVQRLNVLRGELVASAKSTALENQYQYHQGAVSMALDELKVLRSIERTLGTLPAPLSDLRKEVVGYLLETDYNASMDVVMKMLDDQREITRLAGAPIPVELTDDLEGVRVAFDAMREALIGTGVAGGPTGLADWKGGVDLSWFNDRDFTLVGQPPGNPRSTLQNQQIKNGYKFAFDFSRAIVRAEILSQTSGFGGVATLDAAISEDMRKSIKGAARKMTRFFEEKKSLLPRSIQDDLFKEINRQTKALEDRARLYGFTPEVYDFIMAGESVTLPDRRGHEGMIEWQATEAAQGYRSNFDDANESGVPKNWRDSWKHSLNNLRAVESEDLPVQALQGVLEKVAQIGLVLGQIGPASPDKAEADRMRERIEKLYKAVFAKVQERETLQSSSWDPDKVADVYLSPNWSDETHQVYYERFNEDDEGRAFKDGTGREFNLLDKAMGVYFKHYAEDRRKFNMAEAYTLMDLDHAITGVGDIPKDVKALFKRDHFTAAEIAMMERVRRELVISAATNAGLKRNDMNGVAVDLRIANFKRIFGHDFHEMDDAEVDAVYASIGADMNSAIGKWSKDGKGSLGNMRGIITDWMTHRTLAGANNEEKLMWEDPLTHLAKPKSILELRKIQMWHELKDKMLAEGVDAADLDRYWRTGLLRQAANVGYWETYAMGAQSSYGLVKIYDRNKNWYDNDFGTVKQVRNIAYNTDSNFYFSRIVDDITAYYIDENRGKRDVSADEKLMSANAIWQKSMIGKRHGVLPQNRLLTKIARDNLRNKDEFANAMVGGNFDGKLVHAIHDLDGLDSLGHEVHDEGSDEYAFARSVAVSEMIDDGVISFENIEWSKVFSDNDTNIMKWHMADMWADRRGIKKTYNELQNYLRTPNKDSFFKILDQNFYSKRERVVHPFTKLMIPGHFELGKHYRDLWGTEYNMSRFDREELLHEAMYMSLIDKKSEHHLMQEAMSARVGVGKFSIKLPGNDVTKWWFGNQEIAKRMTRETARPRNLFHLLTVLIGAIIVGSLKSVKQTAEGK